MGFSGAGWWLSRAMPAALTAITSTTTPSRCWRRTLRSFSIRTTSSVCGAAASRKDRSVTSKMIKRPASTLHPISAEDKARIEDAIDPVELTELPLKLGNIPSRSGEEAAAAGYVFDWMQREGLKPRAV